MAIAIVVNGAKGHSALQLSRDLGVQYKSAFVLAHWREHNRRKPNGTQFMNVAGAALGHPVSRQWCGYSHRAA
jgi:hypothetical protein